MKSFILGFLAFDALGDYIMYMQKYEMFYHRGGGD